MACSGLGRCFSTATFCARASGVYMEADCGGSTRVAGWFSSSGVPLTGAPDFDYVRRIDWTGLGGKPISLYHMPNWPNEETLVPVFAKRKPEEP